jgi:hypothetical protein
MIGVLNTDQPFFSWYYSRPPNKTKHDHFFIGEKQICRKYTLSKTHKRCSKDKLFKNRICKKCENILATYNDINAIRI